MSLYRPRQDMTLEPPRNRRIPRPAPPSQSWPLQARAVHESVGLVLVSVFLSAGLFWLLALR